MSPELFGQVVHILEADPVISIQITKSVGRFTFYEKVQANESNIGLAVTTKKLQNIIKLWWPATPLIEPFPTFICWPILVETNFAIHSTLNNSPTATIGFLITVDLILADKNAVV